MKEEYNILDKAAHRDGLTVPEGFFDDFCAKMEAKLPKRPELDTPQTPIKHTTWQRFRPYVYMAAMFAGVWCMLKMFTLMSAADKEISFENDPILAEAASNGEIVEEFIIDDISTSDIYEHYMQGDIDISDSLMMLDSLPGTISGAGF